MEEKKEKKKEGRVIKRVVFLFLSLLFFSALVWWLFNIPPEGFWQVSGFLSLLFLSCFFAFFSFTFRWKTALWLALLPPAFLFLRMKEISLILFLFFFLLSWALLKLTP